MTGPLIFIMGVQRSGTNALFRCLTGGADVTSHNESPDGDFFENVLLRPEQLLRPYLESAPGPVVLKPISETNRRSVSDVFDEFSAYPLRVAWIYRDPVNCFHSHIVRWQGYRDRSEAFAEDWSRRNRSVLEALEVHGDRIAIIRYADLITDPKVFSDLAAFLEIPGAYLFRPDSGRGRREVAPEIQSLLDTETRSTSEALDRARRFVARDVGSITRVTQRIVGRVTRQIDKWSKN